MLSTGEQITISKLSMLLQEKGYKAISLTGWQVPIITDENHSEAKIKYIDTERILKELENDNIVVVAGFQGICKNGDITTLGRGGSDTTAVAIAAALKAKKCEIYTDVDGICFFDPHKVKETRKIEKISYDEMLELADNGANVLHNRCVEIGKKYEIPIEVKSTFELESSGTIVDTDDIENLTIKGITKEDNLSKISIIGIGIKNNPKIFARIFKTIYDNNINIQMISMSEIRISIIVKSNEADILAKKIHEEFMK